MGAEITERRDVYMVVIPFRPEEEGDCVFRCGVDGVTEIMIVARKGPMDWIPYVEVWKGDHLHAEAAQHQASWIEFQPDPRRGSAA